MVKLFSWLRKKPLPLTRWSEEEWEAICAHEVALEKEVLEHIEQRGLEREKEYYFCRSLLVPNLDNQFAKIDRRDIKWLINDRDSSLDDIERLWARLDDFEREMERVRGLTEVVVDAWFERNIKESTRKPPKILLS